MCCAANLIDLFGSASHRWDRELKQWVQMGPLEEAKRRRLAKLAKAKDRGWDVPANSPSSPEATRSGMGSEPGRSLRSGKSG
jgi:hypothetical protein